MSTQVYKYGPNKNARPTTIALTNEQTAGHGDHWRILTEHIEEDVPNWLKNSIDDATIAAGLHPALSKEHLKNLLLSCNEMCHINQVLALKDGKPQHFINAFPCVNSPYGLSCKIDRIIANDNTQDAVLRLISEDGSVIYAFDQMYTVNRDLYRQGQSYFVNFGAWAYSIKLSDQDEVIRVEDPEAIRYHRAYNDIVAKNNGVIPTDLDQQIEQWQPTSDEALEPIEINLGNMCAYLFGETLGQEDEAWCQGQVLGKQQQTLYGRELTVFDVAILREPDADPFVVRMATPTNEDTRQIIVNDYIQANIWLQAAIYYENQTDD
ncbi:hypothetical protein [Psychrobacter sp. FDAARGOS_221]|uniref:hypothetical protein n=1 Tax=Psychrobacter sp. FDAARGOS_221 TaxID=1975705 RepID=UPI000BB55631|nr:hypothetical protein [Psychrobacter sp. FDAARGOS_221]PNK61423.1 hypothetical protein A6J60_011480 [Psychrobacter sp. FDAARGOS_221]